MHKLLLWFTVKLNKLLIKHSDRDLYGEATSKEIDGKTGKEFNREQDKLEYRQRGVILVRCPFNPPTPLTPKDE